MAKVKTSELAGIALNWAVGIANGWNRYDSCMNLPDGTFSWTVMLDSGDPYSKISIENYNPSTDWAQVGPIIDREGMHVGCLRQGQEPLWEAWPYATGTKHIQQGPTPLLAAMRCYVASKLGDEVEIPDSWRYIEKTYIPKKQ